MMVPRVKLTQAAVHALLAAAPTRPLMACWTAMAKPATSAASTASVDPSTPPPSRSETATITAASARIAAITRAGVTAWRPAGPRPKRSTTMLLETWPATTATVKIATPMTGTVALWTATKNPPSRPPSTCHQRKLPERRPLPTAPRPRRTAGLAKRITVRRIHPEPKLTIAACKPLSVISASSPLTRDCSAVRAPTRKAVTPATYAGPRNPLLTCITSSLASRVSGRSGECR